jgi:hypothetical protein
MNVAIHYMRPEWFRLGITGTGKPDPADLGRTHVHLMDLDVQRGACLTATLEHVYAHMQGEVWSPNGEARGLIERKGLQHTSMSVGDVVVADGQAFIVARFGFEPLAAEGRA